MKANIRITHIGSLKSITEKEWNEPVRLPFHLEYACLNSVEASGVEPLEYFYITMTQHGKIIGKANCYLTRTDLLSLDASLPATIKKTINNVYPDFLNVSILEVGHFLMLGQAFTLKDGVALNEVVPALVKYLEKLAIRHDADIILFRDIEYDNFSAMNAISRPMGFYPACGFPNTVIHFHCNNFTEYLQSLKSRTRHKLRKCLKNAVNYGLEYQFVADYKNYADMLSTLWLDVHGRAEEYVREKLNPEYFRYCADRCADKSEALIITCKNDVVAASLNFMTDTSYIYLDWGSNHQINDPAVNVYKFAQLLIIERALALGKTCLEMGITNYDSKMEIGATVIPYFYFVRHIKKPEYSKTIAHMVLHSIKQPDVHKYHPFKTPVTQPDPIALQRELIDKLNEVGSSDVFSKAYAFNEVNKARFADSYIFCPEFTTEQHAYVSYENEDIIMLGSNSYLGATSDKMIKKSAIAAIEKYGTGCSGSPLLNGTLDIHNKLEKELADFFRKQAAMLCSTGYQTNLCAITAIARRDDVIIMDERSHRSLFDAAKMSGATYYFYRHRNMEHLEKLLKRLANSKILLVTDSLFSMEGTRADLPLMCDLARQYNARLFVDEAHAVGIFGETGCGLSEEAGVLSRVDLIMTTFSKSFGSIGGCIAGDMEIIDFIRHTGSPHAFSASLPPSAIATVREGLNRIRNNPSSGKKILENTACFAHKLKSIGFDARFNETQIVAVIIGNLTLTLILAKKLLESGLYVNPVGPPAVPEKECGFRLSVTAAHTEKDLDKALEIFRNLEGTMSRYC